MKTSIQILNFYAQKSPDCLLDSGAKGDGAGGLGHWSEILNAVRPDASGRRFGPKTDWAQFHFS